MDIENTYHLYSEQILIVIDAVLPRGELEAFRVMSYASYVSASDDTPTKRLYTFFAEPGLTVRP